MQVALITPTPADLSAFGIRSLSAYLRSKGITTKVIFLPGNIGLLDEKGEFVYRYDQKILDQITELCEGSTLIGVSFMTNYFDRAEQLTHELKRRLDIPVIWGGIHPSDKPEEALKIADMVSIGEGEEALYELAVRMEKGDEYFDISGIWFRKNGGIKRNPLRPLISDLDTLPHFDFSNSEHYVLNKESENIEPLTDTLLAEFSPLIESPEGKLFKVFRTMTDRGCPHRCSFCSISNLKELYDDDKSSYLRARSPEYTVEELVNIKEKFPFLEAVQFFDDTFFARPLKHIERFSGLYKEKVGLPFYCQASPSTLTERKLEALLDAGLVYVEMGIQSGSKRIKELYHRNTPNEKVVEAAQLLNRHKNRLIAPDYHIIIDNPWETIDDTIDTLNLLYKLPKPYGLCIASLVFFPKTELYNKAIAEGIIKDELKDIYRRPFYTPPKRSYANLIIYLFTFGHVPRFILRLLIKENVVKTLSAINLILLYKMIYFAGEGLRLVNKGFNALVRGDWKRIGIFTKRILAHDPTVEGRKK